MIRILGDWWQGVYLRRYYERADDASLADALGVGIDEVVPLARKAGLPRSEAKRRGSHSPPGNLPPFELGLLRPHEVTALTRWDIPLSVASALGVVWVYLLTLGPTVTGEDSGELVAAAYTMGIPHPPGYPTWTMLGKLFTLIPYGTIAWRVNLMSAVFAAMTVSLTYLLGRKLDLARWAAIACALAFGFSREFWEQSVIAEVYTLNAFFFAGCLLLLIWWYETRSAAALYLLAFIYGLSLGNHNTMALLGPVFVAFVLLTDWTPWRRWAMYTGAVCVSAGIASAVHLYLPLRAAAEPPINWGDPETWDKFVDVVTRKQYSFMLTEDQRSVSQFGRQAWTLLRLYIEQFSPWIGTLALPGLFCLVWKQTVRGGLLVAVFTWTTLGYLLILNTRLERESVWVSTVFYIPSWLLMAIGLGAVLSEIHIGLTTLRSIKLLSVFVPNTLGLIAVVSPLVWNYRHNDRSDYLYTEEFARNILHTLESDAIYFPSADHATFPVLYLQVVEGVRTDVIIANKYGYPEKSLYLDMPGREHFPTIPNRQEEKQIEDWIVQNTSRPVYFSARREMDTLPGYKLEEEGLLFRVLRPGETRDQREWWNEYSWSSIDERQTVGELTADYVLSDLFYMQARGYFRKGEPEKALALLDKVATINSDNKEMLNNLGSTSAEHGKLDAAIRYFERALAADPLYSTALLNLAKVHADRDEYAKSLLYLESLLKEDERNVDALRMSAEYLLAIEWYDESILRYQYLATLVPVDAAVHMAIGDLYHDQKNDKAAAEPYYRRSLQLDPNQPKLREKLGRNRAGAIPTLSQLPPFPDVGQAITNLPVLPNSSQLPSGPQLDTP